MYASRYLKNGSWSESSQKDRIKSIHAAIDEIINNLDSVEGAQVIIYGKNKAEGFAIGKGTKIVDEAIKIAAYIYTAEALTYYGEE